MPKQASKLRARRESAFSLSKLLNDAATHMTADLQQRLTDHPGELGTGREEVLRSFLRSHLPKRFSVNTGFVFDSHGKVSKQMDVIIADSDVCTSFETAGGTRYFPCESVACVGQVKSSLTSAKVLREALDNLESAKVLDRSANGQAVSRMGEAIDQETNYLDQMFTFLFVSGKSLAPERVRDEILELVGERQPHLWPNIILAHEQYLVTYCCEHGICPNPMDARGVALQLAEDKLDLVMRFFLMLGRALEVTSISSLPYGQYLKPREWNAEVFHGEMGDDGMPSLLSDLSR